MIGHYDWAGGREAMMRFGPADGPVVVAALALFEEANRTRTFLVSVLRRLAAAGISSALPDLPGTGESLVPTQEVRLADWRAAFAAATDSLNAPAHGVAIRGGALVDTDARLASRWHFAATAGKAQLRELLRARAIANPDAPLDFDPAEPVQAGPPVELAGNPLSRALLHELQTAEASEAPPRRSVRLESDTGAADRKVRGSPLWRRAEPGDDAALAVLLADDIARWVRACEG